MSIVIRFRSIPNVMVRIKVRIRTLTLILTPDLILTLTCYPW